MMSDPQLGANYGQGTKLRSVRCWGWCLVTVPLNLDHGMFFLVGNGDFLTFMNN